MAPQMDKNEITITVTKDDKDTDITFTVAKDCKFARLMKGKEVEVTDGLKFAGFEKNPNVTITGDKKDDKYTATKVLIKGGKKAS